MTVCEAACEELREELGLTEDNFVSLEPFALACSSLVGVYPMYRALLRSDAVITPDPAEIAELAWVERPLEQLSPVKPGILVL